MQGILLLYLAVGFSIAVGLIAAHGLSGFFPDPLWLKGLLTGAVIGAIAFYTLAFVISFQKAHAQKQRGPVVLAQALLLAVNWGLPAVILASARIFAALGGMIGSVTPPFAKGQTPRQSTTGALAGSIAGAIVHLVYRYLL